MATKGSMKRFYRQKKKLPPTKNKRSLKNTAETILSHDAYDGQEEVLRQFDMNMAYGPCLGMSRLARWERASKLGLKLPKEIEDLLKGVKAHKECLWGDRI